MEREIWLMCDFSSDPVWWRSDGTMAELDEIPLSPETKKKLRAWADSWEAGICEPQFGHHWVSQDDRVAFEVEGFHLWTVVRRELGPDWVVGYQSELRQERLWPLEGLQKP